MREIEETEATRNLPAKPLFDIGLITLITLGIPLEIALEMTNNLCDSLDGTGEKVSAHYTDSSKKYAATVQAVRSNVLYSILFDDWTCHALQEVTRPGLSRISWLSGFFSL